MQTPGSEGVCHVLFIIIEGTYNHALCMPCINHVAGAEQDKTVDSTRAPDEMCNELTSRLSFTAASAEMCLANVCMRRLLDICRLMRAREVSLAWREALHSHKARRTCLLPMYLSK